MGFVYNYIVFIDNNILKLYIILTVIFLGFKRKSSLLLVLLIMVSATGYVSFINSYSHLLEHGDCQVQL